MLNDFFRVDAVGVIDVCALKNAGQKTVAPQLRPHDRLTRTQHDKAGKVLIFRAQSVQQPRTHRGSSRLSFTTVHHQQRRFVVGNVGVHRPNDADVINAFADVRKQVADFDS